MVLRDQTIIACSEKALAEAQEKFPLNTRAFFGARGADGSPAEHEIVPDLKALRARWTRLTKRNANVVLLDPQYQETVQAVSSFVQATVANQETTRRRGRLWVTHLLRNLPRLVFHTAAMQAVNALKGQPAIICGAGPSLDQNGHLLEKFQDIALTIGVNSGTKAYPCDVNVCVESNDVRAKLGVDAKIRCYSLVSMPELFEHGTGLIAPVWSGELGSLPEQLTDVRKLHTSVGGTSAALSLALIWGCDPIILVGQDLAYTEGSVYAQQTGILGSVGDDGTLTWSDAALEMPRPGNPLPSDVQLTEAEAWGGVGMVKSDVTFDALRQFLAERPDDRVLINATEGGSRIPGWQELPLSDLWYKKHARAPWAVLRNALASQAPHVSWQNRGGFRALRAWRDDQAEGLEMIARLCVDMQNATGQKLIDMGAVLLDGLSVCRLLETWSFDGILALRLYRQSQEVGSVEVEKAAAEQDLKDAAVILAKDAMSLRELMLEQKYEPV